MKLSDRQLATQFISNFVLSVSDTDTAESAIKCRADSIRGCQSHTKTFTLCTSACLYYHKWTTVWQPPVNKTALLNISVWTCTRTHMHVCERESNVNHTHDMVSRYFTGGGNTKRHCTMPAKVTKKLDSKHVYKQYRF